MNAYVALHEYHLELYKNIPRVHPMHEYSKSSTFVWHKLQMNFNLWPIFMEPFVVVIVNSMNTT